MTPALALGDYFIDKLVEAGIVPPETTHVIIDAKYGQVTELHFSTIEIDEAKLGIVAATAIQAKVVRDGNE